MNNYIAAEIARILDFKSLKAERWKRAWDYRLPRGLARYVGRNRHGDIIKVRYTAKSKGRTGAAVRFHLMQAARARGQA